jgi:hypothetical protein
MGNFGLDWVVLVQTHEDRLFEYEKLLYYHEIPFHTLNDGGDYRIQVPEKYFAMGREIVHDHDKGILLNPVNDFNPRYSTFERGLKVRQVGRPRASFKWQFVMILVLMMFMLALRMLIYLRK